MMVLVSSAGPNSHRREGELRRSKSERAIARRAFDHVRSPELREVIQQAKQRAFLGADRRAIPGLQAELADPVNHRFAIIAKTPNLRADAGRGRNGLVMG